MSGTTFGLVHKFCCRKSFETFGFDLSIGLKSLSDNSMAVMEPVAFKQYKDGQPLAPSLRFTNEEAQALMDEMWSAGVRPSNGEGNVGQIGAMREHLADMRRLVFKGEVKP